MALVALGALLLSLSGVLAPRPAGPAQSIAYPGRLVATDACGQTSPAFDALPQRFTLVLEAAYLDGEIDSGYGIIVTGGGGELTAAIAPTGYVAIWETTPVGPRYHVPWQSWPHVRPGAAANELWLDLFPIGGETQVVVRINRELLWSGPVDVASQTAGVWLGSFGGGAAAVDFQALTLYAPAPGR